jgi:hypothetical protein
LIALLGFQVEPFWFQVEPFGVPCRTLSTEVYMEPKMILSGTKKGFLPGTKKDFTKGSPIGTAEEPFYVLDITFFMRVYTNPKAYVTTHKGVIECGFSHADPCEPYRQYNSLVSH